MILETMWVRRIESGVKCVISVRDFDEALHEDLETDGRDPRPGTAKPAEPPALPAEAPDFQSLSAVKAIEFIRKTEWSHDGIITAMAVERKRDKPRKTVLAEASRVAEALDQLSGDEEE